MFLFMYLNYIWLNRCARLYMDIFIFDGDYLHTLFKLSEQLKGIIPYRV